MWVSAKFGTCTVVSVNGTLVEDKMRRFKGECAHFIFNKCPIYTHDSANVKFSTNSQETDNSVGTRVCFCVFLLFPPSPSSGARWLRGLAARDDSMWGPTADSQLMDGNGGQPVGLIYMQISSSGN